MNGTPDEILEAYAQEYGLNEGNVSASHRRKALCLIDDLRQLRRHKESDPKIRARSIQAIDRRFREFLVFTHVEHDGHQRLLRHLSEGISKASQNLHPGDDVIPM